MDIRGNFKLGQIIEVQFGKEKGESKFYSRKRTKGIVVGVYKHFIVIHNGKYRESFSYADIATGRIQIKVVRAA